MADLWGIFHADEAGIVAEPETMVSTIVRDGVEPKEYVYADEGGDMLLQDKINAAGQVYIATYRQNGKFASLGTSA